MKNIYIISHVEWWATSLDVEQFKAWYLRQYGCELEDRHINIAIPEKTIMFNLEGNSNTIADYLNEVEINIDPYCLAIMW